MAVTIAVNRFIILLQWESLHVYFFSCTKQNKKKERGKPLSASEDTQLVRYNSLNRLHSEYIC